jgi:hypothetical protein
MALDQTTVEINPMDLATADLIIELMKENDWTHTTTEATTLKFERSLT